MIKEKKKVSWRGSRTQTINTLGIGVRAGGRGRGELQPPQILGNSDFLAARENLGKACF